MKKHERTDNSSWQSTTGTFKVLFDKEIQILVMSPPFYSKRRSKPFSYILPPRKNVQRKSWTACSMRQRSLVESEVRGPAHSRPRLHMQAGEKLVLFACVIYNQSNESTFDCDRNRFLGPSFTIQRSVQRTVLTSLHAPLLHYPEYISIAATPSEKRIYDSILK